MDPEAPYLQLKQQVGLPDVKFVWLGRVSPGKRLAPHSHGSLFIDYVSSGHADWFLNGKRVLLQPGHAYLYRPTDVIEGKMRAGAAVVVRGVGFQWAAWTGSSRTADHALPQTIALPPAARREFELIFDVMLEFFLSAAPHWKNAAAGCVLSLISILQNGAVARGSGLRATPDDRRVHASLEFMERNYCKALKISHLADASGISEQYFRRLFQQRLKQSPLQYLIALRLREARRLLLNGSSLTVAEVSRQAGFQDIKHFMRMFRAHFGITPGRFRAENLWHPSLNVPLGHGGAR